MASTSTLRAAGGDKVGLDGGGWILKVERWGLKETAVVTVCSFGQCRNRVGLRVKQIKQGLSFAFNYWPFVYILGACTKITECRICTAM